MGGCLLEIDSCCLLVEGEAVAFGCSGIRDEEESLVGAVGNASTFGGILPEETELLFAVVLHLSTQNIIGAFTREGAVVF